MALPVEYQKDFNYLKDLSDRGALNSNNHIYQTLDMKAANVPELRASLGTLRVNYL